MPAPLRTLLLHAAGGFVVAAVFVGLLLASEAGAVLRAEAPWPALLLWLFSGMTFAVVLAASALFLPDREPRRGRLVPVPVRVRRR
jgi:hypothetical protein